MPKRLPHRGSLTLPVCILLLLIVAAGASAQSRNSGERIDVGGYRLFIDCAGTGTPVVVLEAGLGGSSRSWDKVAPEVARITRVCRYDRAGQGSSDPAPRAVQTLNGARYIALRPARETTDDLQADNARRAPRSRLIVAERSGHAIQNDQPDVVIDAIKRVVENARHTP